MQLTPGANIRGYEVLSSLGGGGMGEVWLCKESNLNRKVAIKVLKTELSRDDKFIGRFHREAKIMSQLMHPRIVQLFTLFTEGGENFMVMEYAEGITLGQLLERSGLLPEARTLGIFRQLAEGLAYAHSKGVIHRDIKPSNIMVDTAHNDAVKIMDFGIAKAKGDISYTLTGETIGTILYMSPEQVRGAKEVDHRSDLYSAGVVLYEMLTARMPYNVNPSSILMIPKHIMEQEIPDPRQVYGGISQATVNLLQGLTRKDPNHRIDLNSWLAGNPVVSQPQPDPQKHDGITEWDEYPPYPQGDEIIFSGKTWTLTTRELQKRIFGDKITEKIALNTITSVSLQKYRTAPGTVRKIFGYLFFIVGFYIFAYTLFGTAWSAEDFHISVVLCAVSWFIGYIIIVSGGEKMKKLIVRSKGKDEVLLDFPAGFQDEEEQAVRLHRELKAFLRL